jgi:hypothetical protein
MTGSRAPRPGLRIDAFAVITHAHYKAAVLIANCHFDPLRRRVLERIARGFCNYAVDLISYNRLKSLRRALHVDFKARRTGRLRRMSTELLPQAIDGRFEILPARPLSRGVLLWPRDRRR